MVNAKEVRTAHILVGSEDSAKDLRQKIMNKELSFEEAARKKSKCPSGKKGGDLGWFGRGRMVRPFELAAFAMNAKGEISQPVKTQFGWHLIKLVDFKKK